MSPQFVDFDADGRLDLVAGTFDGSPKWARGTDEGFAQPVHVLDKNGARIVLNQFWNFDTRQWDETTRCDPAGVGHGHLTSAWACDWDRDGDLDLLLGDHDGGQVLLRRNDGTSAQPAFAAQNEIVSADGRPLIVPGTVTTLQLRDVDGDGRDDLVCGSMGDAYTEAGAGGGVYVYRDVGAGAERTFGAPVVWVPPGDKAAAEPTRPDSGLYMDLVDHDGDGDLDLVVGGYSHWTPPRPALSDEQRARVGELQEQIAGLEERIEGIYGACERATEGLPEAERDAKYEELFAPRRPEVQEIAKQRGALEKELELLRPGSKRRSFVWLHENVTAR